MQHIDAQSSCLMLPARTVYLAAVLRLAGAAGVGRVDSSVAEEGLAALKACQLLPHRSAAACCTTTT